MKFGNHQRDIKKQEKKPFWTVGSMPLYLTIIIPFTLHIGITSGLIKHFSSRKDIQIAEKIANQTQNKISDRVFLNLDKYLSSKDIESDISAPELKKIVEQIDAPLSASIFMISNGETIASNDAKHQAIQQKLDQRIALFKHFVPDSKTIFNFRDRQQEFLGQITFPAENSSLNEGWGVMVAIPKTELDSYVAQKPREQKIQYLAYLLPTVLLGIVTYTLVNSIIDRLNKTISVVAEGSLNGQIDEIPLTQLKAFDQSIKQISEQLQASQDEEETDFTFYTNSLLADMSHELRSPLNAILGFAQIMQQESSMTRLQLENMSIINHSGKRMLSIINDLVDLSKIEINRLTLEENSFDFYFWLENIEKNCQNQAHERNLEIVFIKHSQLPRYIRTDESRLRQIITNLVSYSLRHTQAELITVKIDCSEINYFEDSASDTDGSIGQQNVHFTVENTSSPISSTELLALFNPAVSVCQKGEFLEQSPLSLPISYQLAQLMGGNLSLETNNKMDNDITFCLDVNVGVPAHQAAKIQPTNKKVIALEANQPDYRILIVDDSKTNRKIMVHLLEKVGFETQEAANGQEAVDIWLRWQPHMIWMDIQMPVMNGYEATEHIKSFSASKSLPIVAISASDLETERVLFQAAGYDDFVGKPFAESTIFEKIAQHLGVRYVYQPLLARVNKPFKLTTKALTVMPAGWINQLEQAALNLDHNLLTQLLEEIPPEHSNLKDALQKQVNNFDFDLILNLAQKSTSY